MPLAAPSSVFPAVLGLALLGCVNACSAARDHDHGTEIGCRDDPRAAFDTADLDVAGNSGVLVFQLLEALPSPPAKGINRWTLEIKDSSGRSIRDATLQVGLQMPDHGGHGPVRLPQVSVGQAYIVESLDFFMVGLWQVTLTAHTDDLADTADLFICIEG